MSWKKRTVTFSWLREQAKGILESSIFLWLKIIGLVPADVEYVRVVNPRLNLDPDNIPVGYLASVAFEWDQWGESTPNEFLDALEAELAGSEKRDLISELIAGLGREEGEGEEETDAAAVA